MKIRSDFVTNSSSSAFICLCVSDSIEDLILLQNNTSEHELLDDAYEYGKEEVELNGNRLKAVLGEGYIAYIGWDLTEEDLTHKTLSQLKTEFAKAVEQDYGFSLSDGDIEFKYGEISRG